MALSRWHVRGWNRVISPLVRVTTGHWPAVALVDTRWCSGSSASSRDVPPFPELSPRPEKAYHTAYSQPGTGRIYDKKPFRFEVKKGHVYHWCACGFSHMQPFCDGSHRNPHLKITLKPIRFVAEETRSYWLCNCKQTANRPYCDGSHKKPHVQEAVSVIK